MNLLSVQVQPAVPFHDAQQKPGQSWPHDHAELEQCDPSAKNVGLLLIWDYHESADIATVSLPLEPVQQFTCNTFHNNTSIKYESVCSNNFSYYSTKENA
jgi:hypothetical protein